MKKIIIPITIFLCFLLNISLAYSFAGGTGTQSDPYLISNCLELQDMNTDYLAHYKLINNIDCSATITWNGGEGFEPIGYFTFDAVSGGFDGGGYTISDLYMNYADMTEAGLIVQASGGDYYFKNVIFEDLTILNDGFYTALIVYSDTGMDLIMENIIVDGFTISSGSYAAVFAGQIYTDNAYFTNLTAMNGVLTTTIESASGGLFGEFFLGNVILEDAIVKDVTIEIDATDWGHNSGYGGVVGHIGTNMGDITINKVYTGGIIDCKTLTGISPIANLGGLIGYLEMDSSTDISITNAYSDMDITCAATTTAVGGLIGGADGSPLSQNIEFVYYSGVLNSGNGDPGDKGGIIGDIGTGSLTDTGTIFWDTETSTATTSDIGTGKTTTEMKTASTWSGFDTNIWAIIQGEYPIFITLFAGSTGIVDIATDDFECGTTSCGTGWNGAWSYSGGCEVSTLGNPIGTYHFRGNSNCDGTRNLDTTGYGSVNVTFYATASSLESADHCRYYYYDGTSYHELLDLGNGDDDNSHDYYNFEVTSYGVSTTAGIRMESSSSQTGDYCYLDNVQIVGEPSTAVLEIFMDDSYMISTEDVIIDMSSSLINTLHTIQLRNEIGTVFCSDTIMSPAIPYTSFSSTCDMPDTIQTNAEARLFVTTDSLQTTSKFFNVTTAQQDPGELDIKKVYFSPQVLQGGSIKIYAIIETNGLTINNKEITITFPDGSQRTFNLFSTTNENEYESHITDTYQVGTTYFNIRVEAGTYFDTYNNQYIVAAYNVDFVDVVNSVKEVLVCQDVNESILKVFGTEYQVGDDMRMYLQLLDGDSQGVENATCYADIYYANKSTWVNNGIMSQLNQDKSLYYYDVVAPDQVGVYMLTAECFYITQETDEYADSYDTPQGVYVSGPLYYTEESDDKYLIFNDSEGTITAEFVFDDLNVSAVNDNVDILYEGMCQVLGGNDWQNITNSTLTFNTSNTVFFHRFDNNSALGENETYFADESEFANDGTCGGSTCPSIVPALYGTGLLHDGVDDYVDFGNDSSFNTFGNGITVGTWFKPQGTYTQWMLPISKGASGWGDWSIGLNIDDGWALWVVKNSTGSTSYNGYYSTPLYDIGDWIFVGGTYNGTHSTLFVGKYGDETLYTKTVAFSGPIMNDYAGRVNTGPPDPSGVDLEGILDGTFVINRSMTIEELENIFDYTNGFPSGNLLFQAYNVNTSTWDDLINSQTCQATGYDQTTGNTLTNGLNYVNSSDSLKLRIETEQFAKYQLKNDLLELQVPLYSGEQVDAIRGGGEFHITNRQFELLQTIPTDVWGHTPDRTLTDGVNIAPDIWNHTERNLTYYPPVEVNETLIAEEVWGDNYTINPGLLGQFVGSVWDYVARYTHGIIT